MPLSETALKIRARSITASDAKWLWDHGLNGFVEWKTEQAKIGMKKDRMFRMGHHTESLNAEFFTEKTGIGVNRLDDMRMEYAFNERFICHIDGIASDNMLWQAKHVSERFTKREILERYWPDLNWQCLVTGAPGCWLSVIYGNASAYNATLVVPDKTVQGKLLALAYQAIVMLDLST